MFYLLLEHPTAVNIDYASHNSCFTPLAYSLINGDTHKVSELLKHGSDPDNNIISCEGFSIILALQDPDPEKGYLHLSMLLEANASTSKRLIINNQPIPNNLLGFAVGQNHTKSVQLLIGNGIDVNGGIFGDLNLKRSFEKRNCDIAHTLVKNGARISPGVGQASVLQYSNCLETKRLSMKKFQ